MSVVTLVNDSTLYAQFQGSIERQAPERFLDFVPVHADSRGWNAATALNHGIERSSTDWILIAHQDVIFPDGWLSRFTHAMDGVDTATAVVGLVGVRADGSFAGHVEDPHGHTRWPPLPAPVISVDEHLIAVKRSSGVRFDPENPGFHCYGTDICLTARSLGWKAIVVDAPVVHLSAGRIDEHYELAAEWLLDKWGRRHRNVIPMCGKLVYRLRPANLLHLIRIRSMRNRSIAPEHCLCECDATTVSENPHNADRPAGS